MRTPRELTAPQPGRLARRATRLRRTLPALLLATLTAQAFTLWLNASHRADFPNQLPDSDSDVSAQQAQRDHAVSLPPSTRELRYSANQCTLRLLRLHRGRTSPMSGPGGEEGAPAAVSSPSLADASPVPGAGESCPGSLAGSRHRPGAPPTDGGAQPAADANIRVLVHVGVL
jgi:hypothetical protein